MRRDTLEKVLLDVLACPARFWKKYRSCGGRSDGGVGVRFRAALLRVFGPLLEGVTAMGSSLSSSSALSSCRPSLSAAPLAFQIVSANTSSPSLLLSSLKLSTIVRWMSALADLRRAERSGFRLKEIAVSEASSSCCSPFLLIGVTNKSSPVGFGKGESLAVCWAVLPEVALGFLVLPRGLPRPRFNGVAKV